MPENTNTREMSEAGKGGGRRVEDTELVQKNYGGIKFGVRDKSADTFKTTVSGKKWSTTDDRMENFTGEDDE